MYNELYHIESIYGSVAEYNRVREEEQHEGYEPSEEELHKQHIDQEVYHKKIELLDGVPSNLAQALLMQWAEVEPKRPNSSDPKSYYAIQKWCTERTLDIWSKLCAYHNVAEDKEGTYGFYKTKPDSFAIEIEYSGRIYIEHRSVSNLNYETFKNLFCDLYYTQCRPTMNYNDKENNSHILSNCSLGNLRIYDLKLCGIETDESINRELKDAGFDEETYRKEIS